MYTLTDAEINELTKPSPWRDYISSEDPRDFDEYLKEWKLYHE